MWACVSSSFPFFSPSHLYSFAALCPHHRSFISPTLSQTRATLPGVIRGRHKARLETLTAEIQPAQEEATGSGRGGKSRSKRASTAGAAASEAPALDKVTEDAIKSQAREIREALAVNRQKLTSLEQDALQVLAVVEKKGGGKK